MNVLITGGTGFIGSHVARELYDAGHSVVVFDSFPETNLMEDIAKEIKIVRGDIRNLNELILAIRQHSIDGIVHLAYMFTRASQKNPMLATSVNVGGTLNVFEAARLLDVRRTVWASSDSVYGSKEMYPGMNSISEADPAFPSTVYGASKLYNETVANTYFKEFGTDLIGLRIPYTFGFGSTMRKDSLLKFLFEPLDRGLRGQEISVKGRDVEISLLYIKDLTALIRKILEAKSLNHRVYNAPSTMSTIGEVANHIARVTASKLTYSSEPLDFIEDHPQLDASFIMKDLDYTCGYSIEQGINDCFATSMNRRH